jgi:hypothetical protein
MATMDRQHYALQTIFSFFLGLMVLAFVGVGVNTFYPSPADRYQKQLQPLFDQQSLLNAGGKTLTPADQQQAASIQKQINEIQALQQAEQEVWARNTSIVLVLFATLVMGVSLIRAEQLRALSNGLLLGGLFTMVYGSGWTIFSGTSTARFFVVLFALAVTIALGYLKFVRLRAGAPAPLLATSAPAPAELVGVEARLASLEARADAAAAALGGSGQPRDRTA